MFFLLLLCADYYLVFDLLRDQRRGWACAPSEVDAETFFTIKPHSSCNFSD